MVSVFEYKNRILKFRFEYSTKSFIFSRATLFFFYLFFDFEKGIIHKYSTRQTSLKLFLFFFSKLFFFWLRGRRSSCSHFIGYDEFKTKSFCICRHVKPHNYMQKVIRCLWLLRKFSFKDVIRLRAVAQELAKTINFCYFKLMSRSNGKSPFRMYQPYLRRNQVHILSSRDEENSSAKFDIF